MRGDPARQQFDDTALGATALLGTLTIISPRGPFDWLSGVVALSLLGIVVAYKRDRPRTRLQSLALEAVCALVTLSVVGLVLPALFLDGRPAQTRLQERRSPFTSGLTRRCEARRGSGLEL